MSGSTRVYDTLFPVLPQDPAKSNLQVRDHTKAMDDDGSRSNHLDRMYRDNEPVKLLVMNDMYLSDEVQLKALRGGRRENECGRAQRT